MNSIEGVEIVIVDPKADPRGPAVAAFRTHVMGTEAEGRTAIVREVRRPIEVVYPDPELRPEPGDELHASALFVHVPLAEAAAFFDTDDTDEAFVAWYTEHFVPEVPDDVAADLREGAAEPNDDEDDEDEDEDTAVPDGADTE